MSRISFEFIRDGKTFNEFVKNNQNILKPVTIPETKLQLKSFKEAELAQTQFSIIFLATVNLSKTHSINENKSKWSNILYNITHLKKESVKQQVILKYRKFIDPTNDDMCQYTSTLKEIETMKKVGKHENIVEYLGCYNILNSKKY